MEELLTDFGTDALVVTKDGEIIFQYGNVNDTFNVASIRKSLLSALYGIRVAEGAIDLRLNLEHLGIDDVAPGLTADERRATIEDLLKLRSGVYHVANYEGAAAKRDRPARGSHPHGTFYYYNNWDANVLGTIYQQVTGGDIFRDFEELIARPIGMTRFSAANCEYKMPDVDSIHLAYVFHMTALDLERFVRLYMQKGNWEGDQLIPARWVEQSLNPYSDLPDGNGLGYLWEVALDGNLYGASVGERAFGFSGWPGHYMVGLPDQRIAMVHALQYDVPGKETLSTERFSELLNLALTRS